MSEDESPDAAVVPDEMEQAQTSCRKKTKGLCAFCHLQLGFSVMREHEGPFNCSLPGSLAHKNPPTLGHYSRPMPRALRRSFGGWRFLMSEVPL